MIFVAAGGNMGDVARTFHIAKKLLLQRGVRVIASSSIHTTKPMGGVATGAFQNAVWRIETKLSPEALLQVLLSVEAALGRVRTVRWGNRTLDLDLLCYNAETRQTEALTLPHPLISERLFVLAPWTEVIDKTADIPHVGNIHTLKKRLDEGNSRG